MRPMSVAALGTLAEEPTQCEPTHSSSRCFASAHQQQRWVFLSTKRVNPVPDTEPYTLLLLLLHQISTTSTPSSSLVAKQTNKNPKHISSSHLCFPMRRTPLPSSLHLFISSPSSSTLHLTISRGTAALCTIVMATTLGRQDGGVVAGLASFTVLNVRTARCCLLKI